MVKQAVAGRILLGSLVVELDIVEIDTVTRCLVEFFIGAIVSEPRSDSWDSGLGWVVVLCSRRLTSMRYDVFALWKLLTQSFLESDQPWHCGVFVHGFEVLVINVDSVKVVFHNESGESSCNICGVVLVRRRGIVSTESRGNQRDVCCMVLGLDGKAPRVVHPSPFRKLVRGTGGHPECQSAELSR